MAIYELGDRKICGVTVGKKEGSVLTNFPFELTYTEEHFIFFSPDAGMFGKSVYTDHPRTVVVVDENNVVIPKTTRDIFYPNTNPNYPNRPFWAYQCPQCGKEERFNCAQINSSPLKGRLRWKPAG